MQKVSLLSLFVGFVWGVQGMSAEKHVRFCDENIQSYENDAKLRTVKRESSKVRSSRRRSEPLDKYKVELPTLEEIEVGEMNYDMQMSAEVMGNRLLYSEQTKQRQEALRHFINAFFGHKVMIEKYDGFIKSLCGEEDSSAVKRIIRANASRFFGRHYCGMHPYHAGTLAKNIAKLYKQLGEGNAHNFWQAMIKKKE